MRFATTAPGGLLFEALPQLFAQALRIVIAAGQLNDLTLKFNKTSIVLQFLQCRSQFWRCSYVLHGSP